MIAVVVVVVVVAEAEVEVEVKAKVEENKVEETTNIVDFIRASTCGRIVPATRMNCATTVERIEVNRTTRSSSNNNSRWRICLLL